jgi:hypothetical protein
LGQSRLQAAAVVVVRLPLVVAVAQVVAAVALILKAVAAARPIRVTRADHRQTAQAAEEGRPLRAQTAALLLVAAVVQVCLRPSPAPALRVLVVAEVVTLLVGRLARLLMVAVPVEQMHLVQRPQQTAAGAAGAVEITASLGLVAATAAKVSSLFGTRSKETALWPTSLKLTQTARCFV